MGKVYIENCTKYDPNEIAIIIEKYIPDVEGKRIFVKPNWVIDPWKNERDEWIATVTNSAIIEAVLIVLKEKSNGNANVVIGDAPMARTDIKKVFQCNGIQDIVKRYTSDTFKIELIDIRKYYWKHVRNMCVSRIKLAGDPRGTTVVNLGLDSAFAGKLNTNYGVDDEINSVVEFHNKTRNAYEISNSILHSDIFINLPKLKTHRLAGMTCAMKNLVGTVANKNCVPHRTDGSDKENGDAYPADGINRINADAGLRGMIRKLTRQKIPAVNYLFVPVKMVYDKLFGNKLLHMQGYGAWYGNDTIWRSIIDLNRILLYSDKSGNMTDKVQRDYICIADAIIAGEGEGPLHPKRKICNKLFISYNAASLDVVTSRYMGFNYKKIHYLNHICEYKKYKLLDGAENIEVIFEGKNYLFAKGTEGLPSEQFQPATGWKGYIENE